MTPANKSAKTKIIERAAIGLTTNKMKNGLITHIEQYLGEISQGWRLDESTCDGVQVVAFEDRLFDGIDIYTTQGLSNNTLSLTETKDVKIEYIAIMKSEYGVKNILELMHWMCSSTLLSRKAVSRGDAFEAPKALKSIVNFDAVYFTLPNILDPRFYDFADSSPNTVFVWAIPIYQSELEYIRKHGWEAFEDTLEEEDPSLWDDQRNPVV